MNVFSSAVGFKAQAGVQPHYQAAPDIPASQAIEQAYNLLDAVEGTLTEAIVGGYFDPVLLRLAVQAAMASCVTALNGISQEVAK
ncbi:hypothetical protein [Pseudomonas guariconensis]|uniref:hypothetical protein n=1 Tax=Pseudomonas guariconensis TaxID=1288410 RepID=UPI0018A8B90E|nr:hypothetical protein [Pseudomonas guariconensis]MBF8739999.1 hypothetical protein [Pseudomonas guariconensis]MBF8749270.1 hypothetical protein [Pseudomonas guariconensis]